MNIFNYKKKFLVTCILCAISNQNAFADGPPATETTLKSEVTTNNWAVKVYDRNDQYVTGETRHVTISRTGLYIGGLAWRYPSTDTREITFKDLDSLTINLNVTYASSGDTGLLGGNIANINASETDIILVSNKSTLLGSTYGILAGSTVDAGVSADSASFNSNHFATTTVKSADIRLTGNGIGLLSAIRAIQGAYRDSGTGPAGQVIIKNDLNIALDGGRQEAIYVSGKGIGASAVTSTVILEGNSTIKLSNAGVSDNSAIKLGKSRTVGTGAGELYSYGHLDIDMTNSKGSAIKLAAYGSLLKADYDTSSTTIKTNGNALNVGQNDWGTRLDSSSISAYFKDAHFETSSKTDSLLKIFKNQEAVNLGFTGDKTNLHTSEDSSGWLLDVDQGSSADMTLSQKATMTGLVNKTDSTLNLAISDNAIWYLQSNKINDADNFTSTLNEVKLENNGVLNSSKNSFIILGNVQNTSGVIDLRGDNDATSYHTLTIDGNYVGNDGSLIKLGTHLADDTANTDRLIITGDSSGTSGVFITNMAGAGNKTEKGIEVISIEGNSNGKFTLANPNQVITAGAYDYTLVKGGNGGEANNWYLTSTLNNTPHPIIKPDNQRYNPAFGSYIANIAANNLLFNLRLHDRLGETQYIDVLTGEKKITSMWIRQVLGKNEFDTGQGQLSTDSTRYVTQIGGDIAQWNSNGHDRFHLGVMAGYGYQSSKTQSNVSANNMKGSVHGYSLGLYGTWYQNEIDKTGFHVDSWIMYNWFKNRVMGDSLTKTVKYNADGLTASIETGYTFKLYEEKTDNYLAGIYLQPKAQVIYMGVDTDEHKDGTLSNSTVKSYGDGNIQTRLGVRTYVYSMKSNNTEGDYRQVEPFIEVNWVNNSKRFGSSIDNVKLTQEGAKNIGEVKVGIESAFTNTLKAWGNMSHQFGEDGYKDYQAIVGLAYSF